MEDYDPHGDVKLLIGIGRGAVLGGLKLGGRYRLDEKLGAGAMGEVWKGFDLRLGREVAVKVFPNQGDPDPRRVSRFRNEAKICGQLQHPGIVVVHDADEDNGQLFFVMELLEGKDLAKVMLRSLNGLPIERTIAIAIRLAEALTAAHAKKVIHRDIKPANIMLLPDDQPKICDFGIARVVDTDRATAQIGTPAYAAPEQTDGAPDERSDLYSLGCVLYEMTTGDPPFHGGVFRVLSQHATAPPKPPGDIRADIPSSLEELILQLLAKKPDERPRSAAEVVVRLRAMRQPRPKFGTGKVDQLPSDKLLRTSTPERRHSDADDAMAGAIERVLREARVDARVAGYARTPVLTRFEVRLGPTTPATAVFALRAAIAAAVGDNTARLVPMKRSTSPLPGVVAIGVEVPHRAPDLLSLGDLLREAPNDDELLVGLGRTVDGTPVFLNLDASPHLLIGGTDRSCDPIRSIVASLVMRHHPKRLRLVISGRGDTYTGLPHVVEQAEGDPLTWALAEIEGRYTDLTAQQCRNTEQFNRAVREAGMPAPMGALGDTGLAHPDVVVAIDELTDIRDDEAVTELTREGRAVGFHVIARTAAPSERALSSRVKGYFSARLALPMASAEESLSILDRVGAESLRPGNGMFLGPANGVPSAIRLAAISAEEIAAIVRHWRG
ncbi:DNA translocase FtsK [Nonomuraea sp. NPDC050404]|uniref:DNA translocase FtsK n=1 Tax=Nonomuraea sp. NPDC050404 TaxID=3155783 RepID=UPI0033FEDD87